MRYFAALSFLMLALPGSTVSSARSHEENIYSAVRTEGGMILSTSDESEDQCIDVFGRASAIEEIVPADAKRHRISAVVEKAHGVKVYPPTYCSIGDPGNISSSAYVIIRDQQRYLECSIDTIYVLASARLLREY